MAMVDGSEPRTNLIVAISAASVLALVVIIMALMFYFNQVKFEEMHAKIELAPTRDIDRLRLKEEELLHSYALVDTERRLYQIPIERAIALEAQRPWRVSRPLPPTPTPASTATPLIQPEGRKDL
jgi:hypothetical protein